MSGPEVIETARGVEEFDSRDRALVWRVTGGKHRYLLGEVDRLVEDDVGCSGQQQSMRWLQTLACRSPLSNASTRSCSDAGSASAVATMRRRSGRCSGCESRSGSRC